MKIPSLADILREIKKENPELARRMDEAKALEQWEKAVGPSISKHAQAVSVKNGVLWVEVAHPVWRSELHYRKAQILKSLNQGAHSSSGIRDLYFIEPGALKFKGRSRSRFKEQKQKTGKDKS